MKLDLSKDFDINKARTRLESLISKGSKIELREVTKPRTRDQNAYFHVCMAILGDYAGYTIDEMKIIIKDQLEFMTYEKNGHRFYVSTADLDKELFTKLIDFTRSFGENHGCYIPTPDQYYHDKFYYDKELQHMY